MQPEKSMYDPLVATLNAIIEFMAEESISFSTASDHHAASLHLVPPRYEFVRTDQDYANRDVLEVDGKAEPYHNRRPDIGMIVKKNDGSGQSWYDVALSIEVKKDHQADAIQQAEGQAEAILVNTPTRSFLFSFIFYDCLLEFIEVVRHFASMAPAELGFDETATQIPDGIAYPPQRGHIGSPIASVDGEIYYRIKTVSWSTSCFGRSTRCFEARKLVKSKAKWSNKTYLLKYFWNDMKRQPDEGQIYERVKKAGVKEGVAECVGFARLTKLSDIRKGLPLLRSSGSSGRCTEKDDRKCDTTNASGGEVLGDRQLCVLVLATVGRSISKPTSVHELLSAARASVQGHKEIYEKAKILHRDISTSNVRIRDSPRTFPDGVEEEQSGSSNNGFLIDFDLSLLLDHSDATRFERLARTGTFAFMAWQIMDLQPTSLAQDDGSPSTPFHGYKHDLQSFFWVLLYISAGSPVFTQRPLDRSHPSFAVMRLFSETDEDSARALKREFLLDNHRRLWVANPFTYMFDVLVKIRALLFPENWSILTHDAVISILDEALQNCDPQAQSKIKQHRFEPPYLETRYYSHASLGKASNSSVGSIGGRSTSAPTKANHSEFAGRSLTRSQTFKNPDPSGYSASSVAVQGPDQRQRGSSSRKRLAE
ncbi:hypothetical protein FRC02_006653, partial [Tulasnella sp. 418]